jgi:Na+/H+ antiporter NhaD/arsenite permease-like protein
MLGAAVASWFATTARVREANHFNFQPLREVAILFIAIFATMMPALDWVEIQAREFTHPHPALFYWGTGGLSSVLDNAPTYLGFLSAAFGSLVDPQAIQQIQQLLQEHARDGSLLWLNSPGSRETAIQNTLTALNQYFQSEASNGSVSSEQIGIAYLLGNQKFHPYILSISVGAVFFGANTYIGNGPNFMVKAIADHQKVSTPGFLGLIWKFALPILAPMLILIWLLFFRI